jgi:hypothetical protein
MFADFFRAQIVDVSLTGLDQLHRPVMELLEII